MPYALGTGGAHCAVLSSQLNLAPEPGARSPELMPELQAGHSSFGLPDQ